MWLVSMGRALVLGAATALFLTDTATVPALAAIAFLLGVGETIFDTAFHTTTPQLVQTSLLERANARLQAAEITTNQLLGPPLGGMLLGIAAAFAFGATAVLYAAVMLAVLAIPRGSAAAPRRLRRHAVCAATSQPGCSSWCATRAC